MPPQFYGTGNIWLQWIWLQWMDDTTAGTTNVVDVWGTWNNQTITASSSTMIWESWNQPPANNAVWQNSPVVGRVPAPTPEELERRQEEARERNRRIAEARERARALLLEVLDDEQRKEFEDDGHFHVQTKDGERVYRLKPGSAPVRIKGEDGGQWSYCIHPRDSFPADDTTAALKLMLEAEEERFLRTANASLTVVRP